MEQNDSLKQELQNLSRIQMEQTDILRRMSDGNSTEKAIENAKQMSNNVQFNSPSMYNDAAKNFQNPVVPNYNLSNPFPVGPTDLSLTHGMGQGFVNNASSLFGTQGRFGFIGRTNPGTSYSMMSRDLINMDHNTRVSQAMIAGTGAIGSIGATVGASALMGGIPGLALGIAGGVGVGLLAEKGSEEVNKNSSLRKYLYKNSGKFINANESNNNRSISGFSKKESSNAADFVRTMNEDFYMKDDETMMLLQKYTEGGLLKDAKDLETFKEKMKTLTKTVKEGALMLNETYDNIAELMAEMKKAGFNEKDWKDLMSGGAVLGGLFGEDGAKVVKDLMDFIKNMNAGTGNSNQASFESAEHVAVNLNDYYNHLKSKDKSELSHLEKSNLDMIHNLGGELEATKYLTATMDKMLDSKVMSETGLYYFDYNSSTKDFDLNKDKMKKFNNGDVSYREAYEEAQRKLQAYTDEGHGDAILKWENNASSYMKRYLLGEDKSDAIFASIQGLAADPEMKSQGIDDRTIMGNYFGVKDGDVQNLLTGFWERENQNVGIMNRYNMQKSWQEHTASVLSEKPTMTEWFGKWGEKISDVATKGFTWADEKIGEGMTWVSDKIMGIDRDLMGRFDKEFTTSSDIESISFENVTREIKNTNDLLASGFSGLTTLSEKGYEIDGKLMSFLGDKFNSADKNVEYSRDLITDWNEVSTDLKKNKDTIMDQAKKSSLSETIVAALHKYNSAKPSNEKIDVSRTVDDLGKQNFNYGGNTALAAAAAFSDSKKVDAELQKLGYNVNGIRKSGAQEVFKNISLNDINMEEGVRNKVNELFNTNISVNPNRTGGGVAMQGGQTPASQEQFIHMDLRNKSDVTADQLNKIISSKGKSNSLLNGKGQLIYDTAHAEGIDPLFALAQIANESAWGTSDIARGKNNFSGWGAVDSNPYDGAHSYNSADSGIVKAIQNTSKYYIHGKEGQNTLYKFNRSKSGTHNYTGDNDPRNYENALSDIMYTEAKKHGVKYGGTEITVDGEPVNDGFGVSTSKEGVLRGQDGGTVSDKFKSEAISKNNIISDTSLSAEQLNFLRTGLSISTGALKTLKESEKISNTYGSTNKGFEAKSIEDKSKLSSLIRGYEISTGKDDPGQGNVDVSEFINSFYKDNSKLMSEFVNGKTDGTWGKKSISERSQINEIMKIIEENYNGVESGKGYVKKVLGGDESKIYTAEEFDSLQILDGNGNVDLSRKNKDTGSANHVKYMQNDNKGISDETVKKGLTDKNRFSGDTIINEKQDSILKSQSEFINYATNIEEGYTNVEFGKQQIALFRSKGGEIIRQNNAAAGKGEGMKGSSSRALDDYINLLEADMKTGKYSNVSDALSSSKELSQSRANAVLSGISSEDLSGLEKETFKLDLVNTSNQLVLDGFAKYSGIDKKSFNGDIAQYNVQTTDKANQFYNQNMRMMKGYTYAEDKSSKEASEWDALTTDEKLNRIAMTQKLDSVLDKDKDEHINTVGEIRYNLDKKGKNFEREVFNEYDRGKLDRLRRDEKTDSFIYDANYSAHSAGEKRTAEDGINWLQKGKKVDLSSDLGSTLSRITGKEFSVEKNASIFQLKKIAEDEMSKVSAETTDKALEVVNESDKILKGQVAGLSGLNKDQTIAMANALKGGNSEFFATYNEKNPNAQIDKDIIKTYENLAKAVNGVNLNEFQSIIDTLDHAAKISKDAGNTSVNLKAALSGDSVSQKEFEQNAIQNVKSTFGSDSVLSQAKSIEELSSVLIGAINGESGKINGKEVTLGSDDIQALTAAMSDAIDKSLQSIVTSTDKLAKFLESGMGKSVIKHAEDNGKTVQVQKVNEEGESKAVNIGMEEAAKHLQNLNKQIEAGQASKQDVSALITERDSIASDFQKTIQESLQEVSKTGEEGMNQAKTTVDDIAKTAGDTASTFADTMSKYDGSIKTAITTMEKRIKELEGSTTWLERVSSNLMDLLN